MLLLANSVISILLVVGLGESFVLDDNQGPVVDTTCGPIEGISQNGAHGFRGIPYALPPVGKLRWQPPKKLNMGDRTCWNGTLAAKKYGDICYQRDTNTTYQGSEDCLYMNIFTPTLDKTAKLPVMVWVHGGSYKFGSGNQDTYFADEKMSGETNVVYVNHNYRLHIFGFMALQKLADISPTNTSGNYAFMDTLVVLEWVRDNIENFGGDPSQVTLYGHSAGATHVLALMTSPLSKGLFHKSWLASGSPRYDKLAKDAYQDNLVYLNKTKCSTVDCLLALTSQEAAEAGDDFPNWEMIDEDGIPTKLTISSGSTAIVDDVSRPSDYPGSRECEGYVVPKPPLEAFASGFKMDIPFLVSSTGHELDSADPPSDMGTWNKPDYERFIHQKLDTFSAYIADMALKMYPVTESLSARYQWASMDSDIRVNCGSNLVALIAAKTFNSPVYRYVDTNRPSKPFGNDGRFIYSFHQHDMYAFFGHLSNYLSPLSESDKKFEQNMKNEVISFVRHGHPNTTAWTTFPGSTGLISDTVTTIPEYHQAECEFLFANGFFHYSWYI